jgi:hypothetical protein
MSKANAFAALMKEAKGYGVAESDKAVPTSGRVLPSRPRGKRDHIDYGKIGVYIRTQTIADVKMRLIREKRDMSDLVQDLLDSWLKQH